MLLNDHLEESGVFLEEAQIHLDYALDDPEYVLFTAQVLSRKFHEFRNGVFFECVEQAFFVLKYR